MKKQRIFSILICTTFFLVNIITAQTQKTMQATIGSNGGNASLGRFYVQVPAGALDTNTQFTLEIPTSQLPAFPKTEEFFLAQVPSVQVVSRYKIRVAVNEFRKPIQIVIPVDVPFTGNPDDYITELYIFDGSSFNTLRIGRGATNFLYEPIRLTAGGDTFIALRATVKAVTAACEAQSGVFNGAYCELP